MAFAKENDVMAVIENLLHELWQEVLGITLPAALFPRLTYEDAMRLYGSDKPDRRLGMEVKSSLIFGDGKLNISRLLDCSMMRIA